MCACERERQWGYLTHLLKPLCALLSLAGLIGRANQVNDLPPSFPATDKCITNRRECTTLNVSPANQLALSPPAGNDLSEVNKLNNSQRLFTLCWMHNKSVTPLQLESVHNADPVSITFMAQDICSISLPSQTTNMKTSWIIQTFGFDVKHLVAFDNAGRLWCVH